MKKTTSASAWETVDGFDRTNREYIRLDGDAWVAEHGIREEGEQRGKQNQPGTNETLPDEFYRRIQAWIRQRALDCKEQVGKYIVDELANLEDLQNSWHGQNPEIVLNAKVAQSCQDLDTRTRQSISDLNKERAEYEGAAKDLSDFRRKYQLSWEANYPNNQIAHWLWVPVAMFLETFAGANLLGSVSRGGVIEGWMIALVLTLVNVLLGLFAGFAWRFGNYPTIAKKLSYYALGTVCAAIALIWNDVAGHVRDVYVRAENNGILESTDVAFATAWDTMISQPLPWESLASAGLALVGIAVFVLTAVKAYTADDRFPGYGPKSRQVKQLHEHYQDYLNDALDELKTARNDATADIEEIKSRYEMDRAVWDNTEDRLKMVVNQYPANLRQYNTDLAHLLAAYRSANLAKRSTPPPPFFDEELTIDPDVIQPPKFELPKPPEWGDIPNIAEAGLARVEEEYDKLRKQFRMLDEVAIDYTEVTQ